MFLGRGDGSFSGVRFDAIVTNAHEAHEGDLVSTGRSETLPRRQTIMNFLVGLQPREVFLYLSAR